MLKVTAK